MLKLYIGVKMSPYRLVPILMSEVSLPFCLLFTLDYVSLFLFRFYRNTFVSAIGQFLANLVAVRCL